MFVESFTSSIVNPLVDILQALFNHCELCIVNCQLSYNLGGYSAEVPPLPIPNRVVKLSIADGTALRCGRVGSRHF